MSSLYSCCLVILHRDSLTSKAGIVIVGDFNLVGSRTPLDSMLNNKDAILKDWMLPNLAGESVITWRGGPKASFAPGKLDYLLYTPETLKPENGFLLDSQLLNQAALNRLKLNAADSKAGELFLGFGPEHADQTYNLSRKGDW